MMPRVQSLLGVSIVLGCTACYGDLRVVQGTVVAVDDTTHTLAVRDERAPNAVLPFQLASPAAAEKGDVVRMAFRQQGESRSVVRLMNVTRSRKGDRKQK
ncbi:MAG: hypothetical protein JW940_16505 [Polyangiaceae bacterium]|nr:hypothetical protein [Polyangiaceae bacterium]